MPRPPDPILGPPPTAPGCAHAITLDHQTCGRTPVVHVATFSDATGLVELASCRRHAVLARLAADLIAEHRYGARCDAGRCWPINANRAPGADRQRRRGRGDLPRPAVALAGFLIRFWSLVALMLLMIGVARLLGWRP